MSKWVDNNEDLENCIPELGVEDDMEDVDMDMGDNDKGKTKKRTKMETNAFRSTYWEHFERFFCEVEKIQKARCKYCKRELKADPKLHGTKGIKCHYEACKMKPHEVETNQARINLQLNRAGEKEGTTMSCWRFDQDKTREAMCYWLILDELPFKTIENPGFKHFISVSCPMFKVPSRRTITKDIYNLYVSERLKLKTYIKSHSQRISITTDTWTSIQRMNYMVLTAHFIDDDWILQKRILNFCPIIGHKGEEVGKGVEKCLLDWGIDNIFAITVDNASSNDLAITYLKKRLENWGTKLLGGKYLHMRCIAHIVNLLVQDGLKNREEHEAISRIRGAVKYIRNSPARYKKFIACVELSKVESKRLLCLDVCTRWNSTYLMLETACLLKRAFEYYGDQDFGYSNDLSQQPFDGVPKESDWDRAELLCKFLGHFYKLTLAISGSLYVTSNTVFIEISAIYILLKEWEDSDDFELQEMAIRMKSKFEKYWGSIDKMNMILYFAVILDPRHKFDFLDFTFEFMYPSNDGEEANAKCVLMKENVRRGMQELFDEYKRIYGGPSSPVVSTTFSTSSISSSTSLDPMSRAAYLKDQFYKKKKLGKSDQARSEYEKYLAEEMEDNTEDFDILKWWKLNSPRFPILSKVARDVLAVPVSTVASESAFSTGGRVLDAFRSSLSPRIVQALVCAQDWIRRDFRPINVEEDLYEVETIEKELSDGGVDSTIIDI